MDERDKLLTVLDKLTDDQIRILTRLDQIIAEEQQADPLHDTTDVRARYEQFKQWCAANNLELGGVEAWVKETRQAAARAAAPAAPPAQ